MSSLERTSLGGARKAAILLSLLGEAGAAPILRSLSSDDLERVTEEVANLPRVPVELTVQVLEEYKQMMSVKDYGTTGGPDVAVRMLVKAFGETGAKNMVKKLSRADDGASFDVEALRKTDPQKLARLLAGEHAQTQAMILGHLDPKQASSLLLTLEPEARAECVKRMATMRPFSAEAAAKASRVISRRLGSAGEQTKRAKPGEKTLAEMLNRLSPAVCREILENIEMSEPDVAMSIRDQLFTFEDLTGVSEPDLRELVNALDKKTLMVALKSASEDLKAHIYKTMSSRAVEMLKEDSEMMGPTRGKDVAKAQSEIIAIARKFEGEGKIALRSQGEDEYV
jgi:flagellar motor switch protein FliG